MSDFWHEIGEGMIADWRNFPDVAHSAQLVMRLVIAALFGGMLGFEREHTGKAAGMRTHMIVALGSALFVLVSVNFGGSLADSSRVIQGIVTGIGFLGAGTIIKLPEDQKVKGLTTAAGIWLTAAIGTAAGMGHVGSALLCTILALMILTSLPHISRWFEPRQSPTE